MKSIRPAILAIALLAGVASAQAAPVLVQASKASTLSASIKSPGFVALNPQPIPPGEINALNPQPIPPKEVFRTNTR